jgi:hypothetical protein
MATQNFSNPFLKPKVICPVQKEMKVVKAKGKRRRKEWTKGLFLPTMLSSR